jgi:hypothetical protein
VLRTGLGVPKRPITLVNAQRVAINRLDKPKKPTGTPPVTRRTMPVSMSEHRRSHTVISWVKAVIRCTPVKNEA